MKIKGLLIFIPLLWLNIYCGAYFNISIAWFCAGVMGTCVLNIILECVTDNIMVFELNACKHGSVIGVRWAYKCTKCGKLFEAKQDEKVEFEKWDCQIWG